MRKELYGGVRVLSEKIIYPILSMFRDDVGRNPGIPPALLNLSTA